MEVVGSIPIPPTNIQCSGSVNSPLNDSYTLIAATQFSPLGEVGQGAGSIFTKNTPKKVGVFFRLSQYPRGGCALNFAHSYSRFWPSACTSGWQAGKVTKLSNTRALDRYQAGIRRILNSSDID